MASVLWIKRCLNVSLLYIYLITFLTSIAIILTNKTSHSIYYQFVLPEKTHKAELCFTPMSGTIRKVINTAKIYKIYIKIIETTNRSGSESDVFLHCQVGCPAAYYCLYVLIQFYLVPGMIRFCLLTWFVSKTKRRRKQGTQSVGREAREHVVHQTLL